MMQTNVTDMDATVQGKNNWRLHINEGHTSPIQPNYSNTQQYVHVHEDSKHAEVQLPQICYSEL